MNKKIFTPLFILSGFFFFMPMAHAAISFDNASATLITPSGTPGTATVAYTAAAGSTIVVFMEGATVGGISTTPTSVTYNGTALTKLDDHVWLSGQRPISSWILANSGTGSSANIVVSWSSSVSNATFIYVSSYNGTSATQPDAHISGDNGGATASSFTQAVTTAHANSWVVSFFVENSAGTYTGVTNATVRGSTGTGYDGVIGDSNGGIVTPASTNVTYSNANSHSWGALLVSLTPYVVPVPNGVITTIKGIIIKINGVKAIFI